jgi:PII-like signaling protein
MKLEGEGTLVRIYIGELDEMVCDGLVTLEKVHVIKYQGNPAKL